MVKIMSEVRGVYPGKRFGNRVVLGFPFSIGTNRGGMSVVVKCDCGRIGVVACVALSTGRSTQCRSCNKTTHGHTVDKAIKGKPRLYNIWTNIKGRCTNNLHHAFANYGGRGITVCDDWCNSYQNFSSWAISAGYDDRLQIDRIDNDGNYEPGNCRFVTPQVNCGNRRNTLFIDAFGERKTIIEWGSDNRCVVSVATLRKRIKANWSAEMALTTPSQKL